MSEPREPQDGLDIDCLVNLTEASFNVTSALVSEPAREMVVLPGGPASTEGIPDPSTSISLESTWRILSSCLPTSEGLPDRSWVRPGLTHIYPLFAINNAHKEPSALGSQKSFSLVNSFGRRQSDAGRLLPYITYLRPQYVLTNHRDCAGDGPALGYQ